MGWEAALWWTFLNLLTIIALAFYSMEEMACVSFNKLRLNYYVSKGKQRAIWLNYLIQNPARLFGTTLIGVNVAMFIGSECARRAYLALGLSPDIAPLTQVIIVIIFAELAPMFAARRYPEQVAMGGAPILYVSAKVLTPVLWTINGITRIIDWLTSKKTVEEHITLNQEDLQRILAADEEGEVDEFNAITSNIFSLRGKDAKQIMQPLDAFPLLPSNATVLQMRQLLAGRDADYALIYHRDIGHIVGIALAKSLIRIPDAKRIRDFALSPWFITKTTKLTQILREFRRSSKSIAVVLNDKGLAEGVISLDDVVEEIFGKLVEEPNHKAPTKSTPPFIIDRTFPGEMRVADFNVQYSIHLEAPGDLTLAELMEQTLGHHPEVGESIYLPPFELTVDETSLLEVKKIKISTRVR